MCCFDKLLDFQPTAMPDLGISLDVVFYPDFDICVGTNQVCVVLYLPDIKMTIVKKLREGVAYNKGRNELYVWLTNDDLSKIRKSPMVQIQVRIVDMFTDEMVCSTAQIVNMESIIIHRDKLITLDKEESRTFKIDYNDFEVGKFMEFLKYGDCCNHNDHDDVADAMRYATENWLKTKHDAVGKVTTVEQTTDGLKIHVEPVSGYKLTKGLTFNKIKENIEKSMNKKTVKDIDRIVITKNDLNEVLLRAYSGDEIVEKTIAKCNPNDIFDFNIGAKLAVDRLYDGYDMTPKPKRKLYNGKIFVRTIGRQLGYYWFMAPEKYKYENQVNSIHTVVDGKICGLETRVEDLIYDDMRDDELGDILRKTNQGSGKIFLQFVDGYFVR